jgi:hypothetical protein
MREYPAYGRTIASHVVRGQKPVAIAVLLSARWDYFNHVAKVCIKPEEWGLGRYEFGFLRGLHVVAVPGDDYAPRQLAELLIDLMRAGPSLLWGYDTEGKKIYDGDDAHEVARWARELAGGAGVLGDEISLTAIRTAELVMASAQRRAAELWRREFDRVEHRGDVEASVRWQLREYEMKDRVRALFASPWQAPADARAA